MLTEIAPIIPKTKMNSITMYGIHWPDKKVTDVPHSGHTQVRLARFRSKSQCQKSETKKCGLAGLNLPLKPQPGHFIPLCFSSDIVLRVAWLR